MGEKLIETNCFYFLRRNELRTPLKIAF